MRALVIGNTDGIGLALTRRLLAEGWTVIGLSRRAMSDALAEHARYSHRVCDVCDPSLRATLESIARDPVDLCVYCAGVGELFDPRSLEADSLAARVNFAAMVDVCAVVVPAMVQRKSGHFIGLSSIGDGLSPEAPAYAASKAAVSAYLESLALALRPHGVFVTNVRFGFVETKMAKSRVKPWIIDVERASSVIARAMRDRPAVLSYPKKMAALVWLVQRWLSLRVRLS